MDQVDLLGNAGSSATIVHNGKTYRMARITSSVEAEWALWARRRYKAILSDARSLMSEEEYKERVDEFIEMAADGYFNYHSEYSVKLRATREGQLFHKKLTFLRYHPDISDEEVVDLVLFHGQEVNDAFLALHAGDIAMMQSLAKKNQEEALEEEAQSKPASPSAT